MRVLPFLIFFLGLCGAVFTAASASAQESVKVRTGIHAGYERIVFEWPENAAYTLSKDGARILVRFARAGMPGIQVAQGAKIIGKVETASAAGEPLQFSIAVPASSRLRDFTVGKKVIIDVYAETGAASAPPPPPKAQPEKKREEAAAPPVKEPASASAAPALAPPPAKAEEKQPVPVKAEEKQSAPAPDKETDFTRTTAETAPAVPVHDVEAAQVPAPKLGPHVITLTTVTSVGMAVFERSGWLWLAVDNPDLPGAPQLTGPQKDRFAAMEKTAVPGGIAWRMPLPEGMHVSTDGGGLAWRVLLSPEARQGAKPIEAAIDAANGKIVWPLKEMRREISFEDPLTGDVIKAIPATSADQYAGAPRNYVQFSTLRSAAGLAYVAKADDVKSAVTPDQVSIARPGGLALSAYKDTQSEKIRQAMEDAPASAEPKPVTEETAEEKPPEEEAPAPNDMPPPPAPDESAAQVEEHASAPETGEHEAATKESLAQIAQEKPSGNDIYNFSRWEMGGVQALYDNEHVLMMEIAGKPPERQTEDVITLAKLMLASHRGPEALGMLRIALQKVPELSDNVEFSALRGAALAISGKYDEALADFSAEGLQSYNDIRYWRAYTLAGLEDWRQAIDTMPQDMNGIAGYPLPLRIPMLLTFAEAALRGGKKDLAGNILESLKQNEGKMPLGYKSAMDYLSGEMARQRGNKDEATALWEPLVKNGKDDLYRAKAGLSLTRLELEQKKVTPAQAINRLEGMRYAWRGDELETLVNYRLGQLYVDNKEYLKGLTVLRNAVTLSPGTDINAEVRGYMTKSFRDIFAQDRLGAVSPLDAISIYEEFRDLTPPGEEGNRYAEKLAERLVDADLLGRAASILEYQVNNRLQGERKAEIAIRLAAVRLLDGNPDGALRALEVAQDTLDRLSGKVPAAASVPVKPQDVAPQAGDVVPASAAAAPETKDADPEKQRQIYLLKARALSMKNKADDALAVLVAMRPDADVSRLRTDIAWKAGKWEEAAMALGDLIVAEDISPKNPLTDYQRDIILNRSIALNLSGNRVALANLRERYNAQMKGTTKGQMFEIVTRPRRPDMIGSREAIASMISEIDLFKDFLGGYAKMQAGDAKEPAAPKEPVPADKGVKNDAPAAEGVAPAPEQAEKASP